MDPNMKSDKIKVISFNMKRDSRFAKKNSWAKRRDAAAAVIRDSGASIIGVQELMPTMKKDVQSMLKEYSILGWGRFYGKKDNEDEHSDIILKDDDAEVSFFRTFWLSKKPDKYASRAYYAFFPRICTVAEVNLKGMQRRIRVFNTHFDHVCGLARVLGVRIILDYISRINRVEPLPTIVMGDLNARPASRPIRILRDNDHPYENVHLNDVYTTAKKPLINTCHFFRGKVKQGRGPIDYIFVSDDFVVEDVEFLTKDLGGVYPSDHFPVMATLKFKERPLGRC